MSASLSNWLALTVPPAVAEELVAGKRCAVGRPWQSHHLGPILVHAAGRPGQVVGAVDLIDCAARDEAAGLGWPGPVEEGAYVLLFSRPRRFREGARCRSGGSGLWRQREHEFDAVRTVLAR